MDFAPVDVDPSEPDAFRYGIGDPHVGLGQSEAAPDGLPSVLAATPTDGL